MPIFLVLPLGEGGGGGGDFCKWKMQCNAQQDNPCGVQRTYNTQNQMVSDFLPWTQIIILSSSPPPPLAVWTVRSCFIIIIIIIIIIDLLIVCISTRYTTNPFAGGQIFCLIFPAPLYIPQIKMCQVSNYLTKPKFNASYLFQLYK